MSSLPDQVRKEQLQAGGGQAAQKANPRLSESAEKGPMGPTRILIGHPN